jgi:RNA polymerase sigma-70 factor (ECF subfamily)
MMDRQESTDLLRRAKGGSAAALEELYERVAGKLLAIVRLRMGPSLRARIESRDILQAVLLRSFERIGQFERSDTASLMAWLARIAENEIRDQADFHARQRRDAGREVALDAEGPAVPSPLRTALSQVIWAEEGERLERALESLPEAHREVIVLRKLEELSFREIGARLGRSEDACRMLFGRAMAALALALEEGR